MADKPKTDPNIVTPETIFGPNWAIQLGIRTGDPLTTPDDPEESCWDRSTRLWGEQAAAEADERARAEAEAARERAFRQGDNRPGWYSPDGGGE